MTDAVSLLGGIRVVELGGGLAGAICGKFFADLGADAILVEPPRRGCEVRWQEPFLDNRPGVDRGGLFLYTGAGKRGLTLDLKHPDGWRIFQRLSSRCDLVIDDRVDASDSAALQTSNTRLVWLNLRNFGTGGPYSNFAATELQMAALGGWMVQVGEPDRTPLASNSLTMTAFVAGLTGAGAAMAAVIRARRDGQPSNIELAEQEALLFSTRYNETYYSYVGTEIKRCGKSFGGWTPTYRVFEASDGFVSCAASTDAQVESLMLLAGVGLERFPTRDDRYDRAEEFLTELNKWFRSKTRDEIFHEAQAWRVPMGKVATIDEVMTLEQLAARDFFDRVEHPVTGAHALPGTPVMINSTRPRPRRPAPILGEHNVEILCDELGYSSDDLRALGNNGVI